MHTSYVAKFSELAEAFDELTRPADLADGRDIWIFRGQQKSSWTLEPRIEREAKQHGWRDYEAAEQKIRERFQSKLAVLTGDYSQYAENDIDLWSLMQHHGVPTRLLDWSYSPWVATFFAVEGLLLEPTGDHQDCTVWAINLSKLNFQASMLYHRIVKGRSEANAENLARSGPIDFSAKDQLQQLWQVSSNANVIGFTGLVAPLLPRRDNARLNNQQGIFLAGFAKGLTFDNCLRNALPDDLHAIRRVNFPASMAPELMRRMFFMNIHHSSLFPDVFGLSRFVHMTQVLFPQGALALLRS